MVIEQLAQLWVCGDGTVYKFKGDVEMYKVRHRVSQTNQTNSNQTVETHCQQRKEKALIVLYCVCLVDNIPL